MTEGQKFDAGKPDWSLLPLGAVEEIVKVLTCGAQKYGRDNWINVKNARERYFSATLRHLAAWQSREENDRESGVSHLAHAACNLLFVLWFDGDDKVRLQQRVEREASDEYFASLRAGKDKDLEINLRP